MVSLMAHGRRAITARHRSVMLAYADRRVTNMLTEARRRHDEIDQLYERAMADFLVARSLLSVAHKAWKR
jgi:hypothetical protein